MQENNGEDGSGKKIKITPQVRGDHKETQQEEGGKGKMEVEMDRESETDI